jgi:hypothetical protein
LKSTHLDIQENKINSILSAAKGYKIDFPKDSIRYIKYIPFEDSSYADYDSNIHDSV